MNKIRDLLERNPIIPALRGEKGLEEIIESDSEVVFILTSNLFNIKGLVEKLKENGKVVFVHVDLIEGLSHSVYALDYIIENTRIDGIISTKNSIIRQAKKKEIMVIQRFFLLDSLSLENCLKCAKENRPDAMEILPGLMPKVISRVSRELHIPVIVGGLIGDKEDVVNALGAGAQGVSTTNMKLWDM